jgi:phosphoribosylpyrophosphate synthetase
MKAAGIHRVITMDVHSKGGMQNACAGAGIGFDHLEARCLLAHEAVKGIPDGARVVVAAPDIGSSKRSAPKFQEVVAGLLGREVGFAIARKVRTGDTHSKITTLIEEPLYPIGPREGRGREDGAYVISPDDILATGGTLKHVAEAVELRGGIFHAACYTNGLFTGDAVENLKGLNRLVGTLTVDPWRIENTPIYEKITFVDVAPIFGRAIKETHTNGSINDLLQNVKP